MSLNQPPLTIGEMSTEEIQTVFSSHDCERNLTPYLIEQSYQMLSSLSPIVHIGEANHMRPLPLTLEEFITFLQANEEKNLYFTEGANDAAKNKIRVSDSDIIHKSHFCIDVDYRKNHPQCSDDDIRACAIETRCKLDDHGTLKLWHIVSFTGNGFHIHYVGDSVPIKDKTLWADGVRYILEEFKKVTGLYKEVDMSCVNASRLFRIPGTYNVKNGQKKLVTILYPLNPNE